MWKSLNEKPSKEDIYRVRDEDKTEFLARFEFDGENGYFLHLNALPVLEWFDHIVKTDDSTN